MGRSVANRLFPSPPSKMKYPKRPKLDEDREYDPKRHRKNEDDDRCKRCRERNLECTIVRDPDLHNPRWGCLPCFIGNVGKCIHGFNRDNPLIRRECPACG